MTSSSLSDEIAKYRSSNLTLLTTSQVFEGVGYSTKNNQEEQYDSSSSGSETEEEG